MHMASSEERSNSSRSSNTALNPGRIVIAYDATKDRNCQEINDIITDIRMRDRMIEEVDTITVLGVLHRVLHPMGFQMQIGPESFMGTQIRAIKEEVARKVGTHIGLLQQSAVQCGEHGVAIEVRIVVGAPLKKVILHEVTASNATWVVLDRYLRKDLKFYLKHIPSKVALVLDNLSLDILRPYFSDNTIGNTEHKLLFSLSKNVPLSPLEFSETNEQHSVNSPTSRASTSSQASSDSDKSSLVSSRTSKSKEQNISSPDEFGSSAHLEELGNAKMKGKEDNFPLVMQKQRSVKSNPELGADFTAIEMKPVLDSINHNYSEIHAVTDGFPSGNMKGEGLASKVETSSLMIAEKSCLVMGIDELVLRPHGDLVNPMEFSYGEIQSGTNDFSFDNILGEGGYGVVYKGQLKDGQLITVKVRRETNMQAVDEFYSQVRALRFALHRNIVMLLGYCCKENISILVYEYVCNKSLEWHLFDNARYVLEWNHRHAIAIGIAKALRFLHEECRGSPIIHRDIRPSNILLTHDFVPLLGDCGLAKWRTSKRDIQIKVLGTLAYRAPECLANGICSEKSDVFAFGIVLIQLISGREAVDSTKNPEGSLKQWALPLIQKLALEELVDPRLGDSYSTYELYHMARAAYLCVQTKPEMRPTMGEALLLLEGKNDNLRKLTEQFIPRHSNVRVPALVEALMV